MIDITVITEWLRNDDYFSLGVDKTGQLTTIETSTGKEVNTISSYLTSSLLPLTKKKIAVELSKKHLTVTFKEIYSGGVYNCLIMGDNNLMASAKGDNGDLTMLQAVANYIEIERKLNGNI